MFQAQLKQIKPPDQFVSISKFNATNNWRRPKEQKQIDQRNNN